MRLGIDFGTTRIIAAFVDRGNYPVVSFTPPDGTSRDWFPSLVAVKDQQRVYGWEAWAAQEEPGWTVVRSIKRALEGAGPETLVQIATQTVSMIQLLVELCSALRTNLLEHSNLPSVEAGLLEVMLGVPANANSNQRFLTAEAFRQAGFHVLGLLNEPSAAGIEFGHRDRASRQKETPSHILVYDLGGGTFDASLVELDQNDHRVIASEGIGALGGDDFDEILAELALDSAGIGPGERDSLTQAEMFRLHEECRAQKESLHPNTRHISVDLGAAREGWPEVSLQAASFYERCQPLVQETLHATEDLLMAHGYGPAGSSSSAQAREQQLDALYVTGGGSELAIVARMLREVFGRRVKRSAYTRSATAIGLAIQADAQAGYVLRDKFTRHFGVWREADQGRTVIFDPLFSKGTQLPAPGEPPLVQARQYTPVHNIGHFRYLECSHLTDEGRPSGDITVWDDIRFAFDPALRNTPDLHRLPVTHLDQGLQLQAEESYSCDAGGTLKVTIATQPEGYTRSYRLGYWAMSDKRIVPGRKKKGSTPN
ncbi:MAG: Hsp70 family protein [Acidobacteriota bacterium]|nr:Hsp70 family protein [Acidobacteriota bacterium]